ncbi:MAG TPA: DUF4199 domain-containing protein [Acidobacteriota bacterium]|nr:DUF4199 domain-containing protein [Acidobacteriota bacterium]
MSTTLTYGIYLALANIALTLVGFFLGYQGENMAQGQWFQYLSWVTTITFVTLGIRAAREDSPHKSLSYGRGVGSAAMIGLYAGIISGVYAFIHFKFVNPNFVDYLIEFTKAQNAAKGVPEAQIEQMERGMRMTTGPVMFAIASVIISTLFSTIIGLIAAIFLKRPAPAGTELPPM